MIGLLDETIYRCFYGLAINVNVTTKKRPSWITFELSQTFVDKTYAWISDN